MNITTKNDGGRITVTLNGWLDTLSSPELGAVIEAVDNAEAIVLDFEKVEYISSSGLRQVVASHRKAKELGAEFEIINVGTETMSIFSLTGLDKKINIKEK